MSPSVVVKTVDSPRSREAEDFIRLPFTIYEGSPYWVPWFDGDVRNILGRRHPFFEHSEGEFFVAYRNGRPAGRIAALDHKRFNAYRGTGYARFYFFESADDPETAGALFDAACEWAAGSGLTTLLGPMGFSGMTGGGILIDGFDRRAAMSMMNYHLPYYRRLVEGAGFEKYKDFYSGYLDGTDFVLPDRIARIADITLRRGRFSIADIRTKRELRRYAAEIGRIYNEAWVDHDEYCPMTESEIGQLTSSLLTVADPRLIKVILHGEEVAGFLLGFPDLSAALQRARGKLSLGSLIDIKREFRRTKLLVINGIGVLPKYQGSGANALLYRALTETGKPQGYIGADIVQVAETTLRMLSDSESLGWRIYKTHRFYRKPL